MYNKDKIANIIIYFSGNVKNLGITNLLKMLADLDFRHFKLTGKSVTGLTYITWPKGPVPLNLYNDINNYPQKFKPFLKIIKTEKKVTFIPLLKFDDQFFTVRELKLLENIAFIYRDTGSKLAVAASHEADKPWKKTMDQKGKNQPIDFELSFDDSNETIPRERYEELKENRIVMAKLFGNEAR